jgi:hypothetical protein
MLLLAILYLPLGVLTRSWPDQDLSKAFFLTLFAYIVGQLVQIVASPLVPSKILVPSKNKDQPGTLRVPSDLYLDKSNQTFTADFKTGLAKQLKKAFGLDVAVTEDGTGEGKIFSDRTTAFNQARACLVIKKAANYVEQYEGMYVMMRGLACSFRIGAAYLAGWSIAFYRNYNCVPFVMAALTLVALGGTFTAAQWDKPPKKSLVTGCFWLGLFLGAGFWTSYLQPLDLTHLPSSSHTQLILWVSVAGTWIAAAKCLSSYHEFAGYFAAAVWRDFSTYLACQEKPDKPAAPTADASDDD